MKKENEDLSKKLKALKNEKMTFEQMSALELKEDIQNKKSSIQSLENKIQELNIEQTKLEQNINDKKMQIITIEKEIISSSEYIEMESFGLYKPRYDFASSIGYKERLETVRQLQKMMIKEKTSVHYFEDWTVDGSKAKGRKMTNDNIKLILRSFNNECEAAINKIKYNNLSNIEKRIYKSFEQLNKLNQSVRVSLSNQYLDLKIQELHLAYEYEQKKQEEKEELREQREREREEKALQKEILNKKKIIDKDIQHYEKMIKELHAKILNTESNEEKESLNQQIADLELQISEKDKEKSELDYRNAHASAGYVYIISNIGAFGEDVVKIGVTRRLEPLERISELSSASVPFKFDVHALIFSYEAYQLESNLHTYFHDYRINKVNSRKEFFKVPIDLIENKLTEFKNLTIDFQKVADAEEFRQSLAYDK
ncbi:chromosome partitioning protein ParA [Enterococcus termitis]|uniref:Chromosome partitioning protein ParA n=1 Tax=Enterococcus termitis TaxID=332950 RepID=A0A1E5GIW0_9ENTE|nr:chromosome partitioning protein ParA [Enterococcus termitis]